MIHPRAKAFRFLYLQAQHSTGRLETLHVCSLSAWLAWVTRVKAEGWEEVLLQTSSRAWHSDSWEWETTTELSDDAALAEPPSNFHPPRHLPSTRVASLAAPPYNSCLSLSCPLSPPLSLHLSLSLSPLSPPCLVASHSPNFLVPSISIASLVVMRLRSFPSVLRYDKYDTFMDRAIVANTKTAEQGQKE